MKILWVTAINETEIDIVRTFKEWKKHEFQILCTTPRNDYFFDVDLSEAPITYTENLNDLSNKLSTLLKEEEIDLVIKRAGWGTQKFPGLVPNVARQLDVPCAIWCAEQGEQRDWQLAIAKHYNIVLVNNQTDLEWYRITHPYAKVYLLPFGCVPSFHKPTRQDKQYETEIVCYGNPLYDSYVSKKVCIDNMVIPAISSPYKFDIWGLKTWMDIPGVAGTNVYRGQFPYEDLPKVNSSCKVHLGISANIFHGGYGSKLIRSLACGTFTLWHETVGARRDFRDGYHLTYTRSSKHTKEILNYFIKEDPKKRREIARNGMKFAHENYDYRRLFDQLFAVMECDNAL